MPFPLVFRVPKTASDEVLMRLRWDFVTILNEKMPNCPKSWVGPDFYRSTLPDPVDESEGCSTILIKLETGMFAGREDDDKLVKEVLKALSQAVWSAFSGRYEVEASVSEWHPGWTYLIEAMEIS